MRPRGKILVVDDHVALAENLAEVLEDAGYEAAIADSAEKALDRLAEGNDILALITDYRLPGRSGAELIAELRRRGLDLPAVVVSAYTDRVTRETAEEAGAIAVLPKPVHLEELLAIAAAFGNADTDVLLIDDNRSLAENLAEILRQRGVSARVGTTAEEGFAISRRPRAAVLDFRLPDRSGIDVAKRLTARDPSIRILFVTAYTHELRQRLGADLPGSAAMEKPVDLERLLAWVQQVLGDAPQSPHRR